jgi:aminoglycoside phosphotransferase (APT) family kinase protein
VTNVVRIPGGASRETWSFDARWAAPGGDVERSFIARRDPTASLLESNNDLEFELYSALAGSGIPVPEVLWIEREARWLSAPSSSGKLPGAADAHARHRAQ